MNEIPDIFTNTEQMIILWISTSVGSQWLQKMLYLGSKTIKHGARIHRCFLLCISLVISGSPVNIRRVQNMSYFNST